MTGPTRTLRATSIRRVLNPVQPPAVANSRKRRHPRGIEWAKQAGGYPPDVRATGARDHRRGRSRAQLPLAVRSVAAAVTAASARESEKSCRLPITAMPPADQGRTVCRSVWTASQKRPTMRQHALGGHRGSNTVAVPVSTISVAISPLSVVCAMLTFRMSDLLGYARVSTIERIRRFKFDALKRAAVRESSATAPMAAPVSDPS